MSGPIVRSGASPEFSKNWDKIFGAGKTTKTAAKKSTGKKATAPSKLSAQSKPAPKKKAAKKGGKKK